MAKKIVNWDSQTFFNHEFLNDESVKCNSNEYFKQVSQIIDLEELYKVLGTCYYNDSMNYYPVLLEVVNDFIRQNLGGAKYLLQVWSSDSLKVFEVTLQEQPKVWGISFNHFMYILEGEGQTNVVRLSDGQVAKVKNFGQEKGGKNLSQYLLVKYLTHNCSGLLYSANDNEIRVLRLPDDAFGSEVDAQELGVRTISTDSKIHGLYLDDNAKNGAFIIVAFEGYDSQLDFNMLKTSNVEDESSFSFSFVQYRQKNHRGNQMTNDPITKVQVVFNKNINFSLSQRESGLFDIYTDMVRQESPTDSYVIDIQMSIYTFFFKTTANKILKLDHHNKKTIKFESAEEVNDYNFDWNQIHIKILKNTVKLYSAVHIDGNDFNAVICHGQFLSIYDLVNFKWKSHIVFEDQIKYMFWIRWTNLFINVLLSNGQVYYLDFNKMNNGLPECDKSCKIEGEIIRCNYDRYGLWPLFVTVYEDDIYKLKLITRHAKTQDLGINSRNSNLNAINFKTKDGKYLALIQDGNKFAVYNQSWDNNGVITCNIIQNLGVYQDITGIIHSVITYDFEKHLMLFDKENAYLIKFLPEDFVKFEKIYCISCLNDGYTGNFAICQETQDSKYQGFRYLDLQTCIDQNRCALLPLADVEIGALDFIEWGLSWSRWGFISSLKSFIITHYPDRVQNRFFNEKGTSTMYFYKQIKDKFIAFSTDKKLYTWDVVTGKIVSVIQINGHDDIDEFEQFNPRGYKSTMFKSKTAVTDSIEKYEDFYLPWQLESSFDNQASFRSDLKSNAPLKCFRDYEIDTDTGVRINVEFVFPSHDNLYLNLNNAKDRLVSKDTSGLVQIYQAQKVAGKPDYYVRWQIIKVIQDFPQDLHIYYQYRLDFFSPDFSRFINIDSKDQSLFIQDTYTGQVISRVPKDLAELKDDQLPFMTICRMTWTDNRTLKIANEDGYEKLVDVEDSFKEIAHNQIPLFNQISGKEWVTMYHIYISREASSAQDVKLKRLYQNYKSLYFLQQENKDMNRSDFYQLMFENDFEFFNHYNHSFTLLQWQVAEKLKSGSLKVDDLSEAIIKDLIYAVFPGGNTILHYLTDQPEQLLRLLQLCHPDGKIKYHVPFLPNFQKKTPIHLCIERNSLKSLDALLGVLGLYEADHHSRAIKDCLSYIVENQIPEFADYIESRFLQTPQLEAFKKGTLPEDSDGMSVSTPWLREQEYRENNLEKVKFERKIKLEVLDVGVYHYNDKVFDQFFDTLAGCDNVSYFELRSLQTIIDFNYGLVQQYLIKKLFIPFCVFQLFYAIWINYTYENRSHEDGKIYYWVFMIINLLFATYFFQNEVRQFFSEGFNYLKSGWNYIDIIPPIGIYIISITTLIEYFESADTKSARQADELARATEQATQSGVTGDDIAIEAGKIVSDNAAYQLALERQLVAITTLFMWFKFLYFFRIFQPTAYLIRMIVTVIVGMKYFLLMLLVTIIGFGNAFLVISMGNVASDNEDENKRFIGGFIESMLFAYRMVLGDFDTTQFGEVGLPLVYFFFLSFTVFNMIVMLNLLIAIISDSYASVVQNAEQASFQEKASMIAENSYLIPKNARESYAAEGQFILVATDLETEEKPVGQDALIQGIKNVESKLRNRLQEIQDQVVANQQEINSSIDELKVFIIKNMPQQIVQTKINANRMVRMTLFSVRQLYDGGYSEWRCQGFKFTGCHGQQLQEDESNTRRTDPKEEFHHCGQCNFDMCQTCYRAYGDIHQHKLELLTLEEVQVRDGSYSNGWGCDCRHFQGCPLNGKRHTDQYSVLFHDQDNKFDLCEKCAYVYQS